MVLLVQHKTAVPTVVDFLPDQGGGGGRGGTGVFVLLLFSFFSFTWMDLSWDHQSYGCDTQFQYFHSNSL